MGTPTGETKQCPSCASKGRDRSQDNLVMYVDREGVESGYCFACGHVEGNKSGSDEPEYMEGDMNFEDVAELPILALEHRGLNAQVSKIFKVRTEVDEETGESSVCYFPLYDPELNLLGYQAKAAKGPGERTKKDTWRVGSTKGALPFGAHVHRPGGKMVIVTEGAEDMMAATEMLLSIDKKYRVVSTLGTDGWKNNLDYFESFQKVVIAFDQGPEGKEAAIEFAEALTPGKAVLARWRGPADDPNALHGQPKGADKFYDAICKATPHQPSGIVWGEEVWRRMENYEEPGGIPYPEEFVGLNEKLEKMRWGEISLWTAGTSVGKTSYIRRLKQHILSLKEYWLGEVELEERGEKTWRGLMQFQMQKKWAEATREERRAAYEATYGSGRIFTLDHRSQYNRGQSLMNKFKHLHYGMGCNIIFLDHITLAVSEFGDGSGLVAQDQMMNQFLEFVESTNTHLCLISHLRKAPVGGGSFEEGAIPMLDDLKGSGSLKQVSFDIIGVSRNLMAESDFKKNVSTTHVLKCRETGRTGRADRMYWDDENVALVDADQFNDEDEDDDDRDF